jgi:hypothetical protein
LLKRFDEPTFMIRPFSSGSVIAASNSVKPG